MDASIAWISLFSDWIQSSWTLFQLECEFLVETVPSPTMAPNQQYLKDLIIIHQQHVVRNALSDSTAELRSRLVTASVGLDKWTTASPNRVPETPSELQDLIKGAETKSVDISGLG